jgi:hypothetical protein
MSNVRRHEISKPWEHVQCRNTGAVATAAPFDSRSKQISPNSRCAIARSAGRRMRSWSKSMKASSGCWQAKNRSLSTSSTRRLRGTTSARCAASTRFTASVSHQTILESMSSVCKVSSRQASLSVKPSALPCHEWSPYISRARAGA